MAGEQAAIATALAETGTELAPELDLFAEPESDQGRAKAMSLRSGPGRPPGARNKRTLRSVEQLLGSYLDPRAKALWIVQQHPADLAALWHCTLFEAAQEQRLWALGVLPYVAARITPDVIDNRQVIHLTIGAVGGDLGGAIGGAAAIEYRAPIDASDDLVERRIGTMAQPDAAMALPDQPLGRSSTPAPEAGALPQPAAAEDPS